MLISKVKFKVSIILPVFNRKDIVKRSIGSVLNQTFENFELIIVDDGSNDGGSDSLLKLVNDRIRYIKHSNRSTPLSLNTGISISSGEYITFIDSDDEYKTTHLEQRVRFMTDNPDIDLIHSSAKFIGSTDDMYVPDKNDTTKLIHISKCIIGATIFAKRKVFNRLQGFRNVYSYDSEFVDRAQKYFKVKKILSDTYLYYRNSSDSVLNKLKKLQRGNG
ncbi:MAG: glycosyltransferase family A protein [Ignavibacteriaceae bacterium]|jgi:Glycosyltransferases involved in cell wall biogenesis|nr:MAG: glycosyltransferase family 2 protein [Chlorobiota bacterium]KXK03693.1 MAG: glycosyl transferase [Chlorobi bacterium OLB4]MBV6398913.1 hypothetical protein [Ignavibacteria bacterium]MCC6886248.1 glycosyltransferase family 2 protein [Ignavibacteriales bacterium]MCE7952298.1 glycosyltransferase family 2 protein [Chlorobi bacterium CHB7]MEB2328897.1 glycosyltransferase family A protein [Ignavibacteriaceae bacterium]OQY77045.1 MAG: hypothetical protein B6D43_08005 [Ignavibacteriales bacte